MLAQATPKVIYTSIEPTEEDYRKFASYLLLFLMSQLLLSDSGFIEKLRKSSFRVKSGSSSTHKMLR